MLREYRPNPGGRGGWLTYTFERPNRALIRFGDIIVARAIQEDAARYAGLTYWDYNWRKGGGAARMIEISKRESFYQQEYCGCVYSLRDSNHHRRSINLKTATWPHLPNHAARPRRRGHRMNRRDLIALLGQCSLARATLSNAWTDFWLSYGGPHRGWVSYGRGWS
jgi:hypothetical protein